MVDLNNNEQIECKKLSRNLLISFLVAEKSFLQLICSTFTCQAECRSRETGIAQKVNDIWIAKLATKAEREKMLN